ncbi:hypothetical protein [Pseudomonas sp. NMS19W]|uniref:hypothetical protein n=1 Tax=Pseudomonas sp. NMS19W TaxID=3079768 RepID=UPI003F65BF91
MAKNKKNKPTALLQSPLGSKIITALSLALLISEIISSHIKKSRNLLFRKPQALKLLRNNLTKSFLIINVFSKSTALQAV